MTEPTGADMAEAKKIIATLTDKETGKHAELTAEQLGNAVNQNAVSDELEKSFSIVGEYDGGLVEIDAHPENTDAFNGVIPICAGGSGLRRGRYFVLYDYGMRTNADDDDTYDGAADVLLLALDAAQIAGDELTPIPITLTAKLPDGGTPEPGEAPYDSMALWAAQADDNGKYVTFTDLLQGLTTIAALKLVVDFYGESLFTGGKSERLPKQDTIKPRVQIDPNSKLANKITLLGDGETVALDVSGAKEKEEVKTVVTLEYEGEGIKLAKPMTQYDREIHNAVTTLWKAGNISFTARQVWHALTGRETEKPPTKQQLAREEESLDKQRFTRAVVDYSQEARGRELTLDGEAVTAYKIDAYMLNAEKHTIETANGRTVEGYTITRPPVLYQHAAMFGQLVTYPMRYLAAGNVGQNSEENIIIRKYLLRRIGMAKGKGKVSPRIKYSSVYDKVGIPEPDKKQRKRINDYVVGCLEALVKEKAIKGFTEYKEGRTRAGVDLIV